jgi:dTDP-4-amino-4,6-dideoxygalactose transaminase
MNTRRRREVISKELKRGIFDIVGYMLTSARGLIDEPKLYGPFRLIDGVSRLCELLINEDKENSGFYKSLKTKIDEGKYSVMSDKNSFIALMDEIRGAIGLVQLRKVPKLCSTMRQHQQNIKSALLDIPQMQWRKIIDPEGDTGFCLGWTFDDKKNVKKFIEAMQHEGIPVITLPTGVHQYRYMTNLLNKIAVTTQGCPWSCPFNKESNTNYSADMLPQSNDIFDRSMMLTMPPLLTEEDEKDAITAIRKVAGFLF